MSSAREHHAEAEKLMQEAKEAYENEGLDAAYFLLEQARVHATLAASMPVYSDEDPIAVVIDDSALGRRGSDG